MLTTILRIFVLLVAVSSLFQAQAFASHHDADQSSPMSQQDNCGDEGCASHHCVFGHCATVCLQSENPFLPPLYQQISYLTYHTAHWSLVTLDGLIKPPVI